MSNIRQILKAPVLGVLAGLLGFTAAQAAPDRILNVSYDVSRELFAELNPVFAAEWKEKTGQDIKIEQSHAGSSRQARLILEGLEADVVTFNQVTDIDVLHESGDLLPVNWAEAFPHNSSPWYSAPAFLVRKGNPKNIRNWDDLAKDGVEVIFPNPKTSGNGRYTYLAAYGAGLRKFDGDEAKTAEFVKKIFANVPVFDTGGRAATQTFAEREIGDVLITFEAEVHGIAAQYEKAGYEIVTPPVSLLAEFPVAVVDKVAERRGSAEVSRAYLDFLYSRPAQEIAAKHFYRVRDADVAAANAETFPEIELIDVNEVFGGWKKVTEEHFGSDGKLDTIFVGN